jgi:PAN-like domain
LNCTDDGFISISNVKLPETTNASIDSAVGLEQCGERCLANCSCTTYSNSDVSNEGSGCMLWVGDLIERQFSGGGQTLYYHVADSEVLGVYYFFPS